jgi:formylglycine-generating enzyme required for sulfatase activity
MGSLSGEVKGGVSPHEVTITKSYYLGVYEVTQAQYERVIGKNPSCYSKQRLGNSDSRMYPVEMLSWEEAVVFCKNLSELPEEKSAGREYRLPTEAEWEYACRATSIGSFCFGDSVWSLGEYAWFGEGPTGTTHPVGQKKPNRWGLYDMHGNVAEWCQDWFGENAIDEMDPIGPDEGLLRVLRGGVYEFGDSDCPSWQRTGAKPADIEALYGFRVAMSPLVKQPER